MNNINNELPLWLCLWRLPGVGAVTFHRLLQAAYLPKKPPLKDLWQQSNPQLKSLGLKQASISLLRQMDPHRLLQLGESFRGASVSTSAPASELTAVSAAKGSITPLDKLINGVERDLHWVSQSNRHIITYHDSRYPALLKEIPSPPPLLFVQGNADLLSFPQLAIVGSRHATRPGLQNTRMFTADLVKRGYTITSGLALGVDAQAHQACLTAEGQTIAVVGSGLDVYYPKQNQALARQIGEQGALVSEFPIGTQPIAQNFPRRNRIICGLSLGTLVVEATERSGSLITARLAADQGREVFAIPGSIHNAQSRGCHLLIKQGATLVQSSDDIIEHLSGMTLYMKDAHFKKKAQITEASVINTAVAPIAKLVSVKAAPQSPVPSAQLSGDQEKLMNLLGECPVPIDRLVEQTTWSVQDLSSLLMNLQLEGLVNSGPGGYVLVRF